MLEPRPPSVAVPAATTPPGAPAEGERPDPLAADVARAVRELRVAAGLSERAAARLLGTSQTQLRRMEDPRYLPSLRSLARVAAAYGQRLRIAFESKEKERSAAAGAGRSSGAAPRARERARRPPRTTNKTGGPKSDRAAGGRDARQRPGARRRSRRA